MEQVDTLVLETSALQHASSTLAPGTNSQVVECGIHPTLVGSESVGSTPTDEMVSLVTGSNPVLTTKETVINS